MPRSLSLNGIQKSDWFELIVEGVPVALLMADQQQRISLVNRNTEILFGYSRSELIGQPLELLVPQRFRGQHAAQVSTYLETPTQRRMGAGRELFGRRKNATEMPIEIGLSPIRTAEGVLTLASIIDITERKRAEDVEGQMAALVESADDAIVAKSLDGIVRSWNPVRGPWRRLSDSLRGTDTQRRVHRNAAPQSAHPIRRTDRDRDSLRECPDQ